MDQAVTLETQEHSWRVGGPLAVIFSPSSPHTTVRAGEPFDLSVVIVNQGERAAIVEVAIEEAAVVRQWCLAPCENLALAPGESNEVIFRFQIPPQVLPDSYAYQMIVDSPEHYPDATPIQFARVLQVLSQAETVAEVGDATFTVQPLTTSQQRAVLQPGSGLALTVHIHNRSNRVDRFHLTCPDLAADWWHVRYPSHATTLGVPITASNLPLNPDSHGELQVTITPPPLATAGRYTPTLRVHSDNDPDLSLLSLVHFDVTPFYEMEVTLTTHIDRVSQHPGEYELVVHNGGNTTRQLQLSVQNLDRSDSDIPYHYTWVSKTKHGADRIAANDNDPPLPLFVDPQQSRQVGLQIFPTHVWRRPWFGTGQHTQFAIALEDVQQHPLPVQSLPGSLLWKARPWWQLAMVLLAGAGVLSAIALLIWWWVLRPLRPPQLVHFGTTNLAYHEADAQPIRLQWHIRRPQQLDRVDIVGLSPEGEVISEPTSYDFSEGIPTTLEPFCYLDSQDLTCDYIPTDARRVGTYIFTLELFTQGDPQTALATQQTATVKISPTVPPNIRNVSSQLRTETQLPDAIAAFLNLPAERSPTSWIAHRWEIHHPEDLQALQLTLKTPDGNRLDQVYNFDFADGIPPSLRPFCVLNRRLVCQNVPTLLPGPGDYIYELTALSTSMGGDMSDSQASSQVTLQSEPPDILSFQINGQEALPKYLIPAEADKPFIPLTFTWEVKPQTGVEVQILPTPGTVPLKGEIPYYLAPEPHTTFLTLQVTNAAGQTITRTVELQVFDPNAEASEPSPIEVQLVLPETSPPPPPPSNSQPPSNAPPDAADSESPNAEGASPSESPASRPRLATEDPKPAQRKPSNRPFINPRSTP